LMNRTRSRMVCNLSHELRTPLTAVLGFSELILQCRPQISEVELAEYLEKILDGSTQMERLINGMLLLFSIDSGTAYWKLEPLDLFAILQQGLADLSGPIAKRQLQVRVDLPSGLFNVAGDSEKTPVALSSLLDNAVKFNRDGGRIEITAEATDGFIRLRIFNNGVCVPASFADAIFAPYNQLGEIDVDKPSGVGIGLSLCRIIIEHAGGRINLDPTDGDGTAFILELPLWDAAFAANEV